MFSNFLVFFVYPVLYTPHTVFWFLSFSLLVKIIQMSHKILIGHLYIKQWIESQFKSRNGSYLLHSFVIRLLYFLLNEPLHSRLGCPLFLLPFHSSSGLLLQASNLGIFHNLFHKWHKITCSLKPCCTTMFPPSLYTLVL